MNSNILPTGSDSAESLSQACTRVMSEAHDWKRIMSLEADATRIMADDEPLLLLHEGEEVGGGRGRSVEGIRRRGDIYKVGLGGRRVGVGAF